jgi:hypothetical protein
MFGAGQWGKKAAAALAMRDIIVPVAGLLTVAVLAGLAGVAP